MELKDIDGALEWMKRRRWYILNYDQKEIVTIQQALELAKQNVWQDISTAPKDGTIILCKDEAENIMSMKWNKSGYFDPTFYMEHSFNDPIKWKPTK